MYNETFEVLKRALEHTQYGVNVKLATLPVLTNDTRPTTDIRVLSQHLENGVAKGLPPVNNHVITIQTLGPAQVEGEVMTRVRESDRTPFIIRYWGKGGDSAEAYRQAHYVLRAMVRCLRDFMRNANDDDRTIGDIYVESILSMEYGEVEDARGKAAASAAIELSLRVRDNVGV